MGCAKRIDGPVATFLMSNQGTNADDGVINVLGKFVAHRGANFVIAPTAKVIGGGEPLDVGDRFDIPDDDATHMAPTARSYATNSTRSRICGSSFSGLLTLVLTGQLTMLSAGYGRIRSAGPGSAPSQRS